MIARARLETAALSPQGASLVGSQPKLANADAEQLVKDYAVIEALCHSGLWTIE